MWVNGTNIQTSAEYKSQLRQASLDEPEPVVEETEVEVESPPGMFELFKMFRKKSSHKKRGEH